MKEKRGERVTKKEAKAARVSGGAAGMCAGLCGDGSDE